MLLRTFATSGSECSRNELGADGVRSDPLDPSTYRHAPECEFVSEADPAVVRVLLKVRNGAGGDYWWVQCGACDTAWQVPYYAASVG